MITIKKAKVKEGRFLDVEYSEQTADGGFANVTKQCKAEVHPDLIRAFKELDMHLANLSYQGDVGAIECTGFSISGSGDSAGVVLIGKRELPNDKVLNITTPFQRFEDDFFFYNDNEQMIDALGTAKTEVYSYLFEAKHKEDNQLSIEFEELEEIEG